MLTTAVLLNNVHRICPLRGLSDSLQFEGNKNNSKNSVKGVLPQLSGFICAFHRANPGSRPKYTIYAFIIYSQSLCYICLCNVKRTKNKQNRDRDWPIKNIKLGKASSNPNPFMLNSTIICAFRYRQLCYFWLMRSAIKE